MRSFDPNAEDQNIEDPYYGTAERLTSRLNELYAQEHDPESLSSTCFISCAGRARARPAQPVSL